MSVSAISALLSSASSTPADTPSAITHTQHKRGVQFKDDFALAASNAFDKIATSTVAVSSNVAAALNNLKPIA